MNDLAGLGWSDDEEEDEDEDAGYRGEFWLLDLRESFVEPQNLAQRLRDAGDLRGCKTIFLNGNDLTHVPAEAFEELAKFPHLRTVHLHDNLLVSLPPEIALLTRLRCLCVHRNKLTGLPLTLLSMPHLEQLDTMDNEALGLAQGDALDGAGVQRLLSTALRLGLLAQWGEATPLNLRFFPQSTRDAIRAWFLVASRLSVKLPRELRDMVARWIATRG